MVQDLFSNVLNGIRDGFIHVSNANPTTLGLVIVGFVVVGFVLLKR